MLLNGLKILNSMILTTIEQKDYDIILAIQKNFPNLTFQHEPYQEWIPAHFTEEDKNALNEVKSIIKKSITGFRNFTNFYYNKKGILNIRFYYDWSYGWNNDIDKIVVRQSIPFTGVGYLELQELLNGFNEDKI